MEDEKLLALFYARDESAIAQTGAKYGEALRRIAKELLGSRQDAEEIVNDALLAAWNSISAERPMQLFYYLAAVTRNLAIKRLDAQHAQRRGGGQRPAVLDELAECVAAPGSVEQEISSRMLWEKIRGFLREQPEQARRAFVLRYTYAMPLKDIADELQMNTGAVKISLHRTRKKLKAFLEQEGWL